MSVPRPALTDGGTVVLPVQHRGEASRVPSGLKNAFHEPFRVAGERSESRNLFEQVLHARIADRMTLSPNLI